MYSTGSSIVTMCSARVSLMRSSMAAIGNLNDYVKYQMGQGMATGGGGVGGTAAELAVGFGIAQQMMQQGFMNPNAPATTR